MSFVNRDTLIAERFCAEYNGLKPEINGDSIHLLIQVLQVKISDISKRSKREFGFKRVKDIRLH